MHCTLSRDVTHLGRALAKPGYLSQSLTSTSGHDYTVNAAASLQIVTEKSNNNSGHYNVRRAKNGGVVLLTGDHLSKHYYWI